MSMLFKVNLVMVLVFEEKEKAVNLLVNPRKPVEKAMQVCWENIHFSTFTLESLNQDF